MMMQHGNYGQLDTFSIVSPTSYLEVSRVIVSEAVAKEKEMTVRNISMG